MCKSCSNGVDSINNIHHCKECKDDYKYYLIKGNEYNCYLNNCTDNQLMQIENTFQCISTLCIDESLYKFNYNNQICYSKCSDNTFEIDDNLNKKCVDLCENPYPYYDLSLKKCYKTSCYENNLYEKGNNNEFECINTCPDDLKYYFKDDDNKVAKCLNVCQEPKKFNDKDNNLCLSECPNNKPYYTEDFICLIQCPPNYFTQFETNKCVENCGNDYQISSNKTCFNTCPNSHPLYLSTTKECVQYCTPELPYQYDNKCVNNCRVTDKIFLGYDKCVTDCNLVDLLYYDPDDLKCYLNCPNEKPYIIQTDKICSFNCTKESPYIDKEYKICYDDCKNNILKPYTFENECLSQCPNFYISMNGICVPNIKLSNINETFDYSNLNFEEMKNSLSYFINLYKDVKKNIINDEFILQVFHIEDNELKDDEYISKIKNIKILENKIKSYYNITEDLIFAKIELLNKSSIINHVELKVYDKKGNELNLDFLKEEIIYSYQINNLKLMDFEKGYYYNKKGINIYNSNDKCFNSFCCSIIYKGKMLNLEERRNIIYKNITFCKNNCYLKSINYKNKKIECSCIINPSLEDSFKINKYNNNSFIEYEKINKLINHNKILSCLNLINDFSNLKSNIGFWVSSIIICIEFCTLFIFFIDIKQITYQIYKTIYFNPPIKNSKNQNYNVQNSSLTSSRKSLKKIKINDSNQSINKKKSNIRLVKNSVNNNNSNKHYYINKERKNDNNPIIDENKIEEIVIRRGKKFFSILNQIKDVKYDIDNYNMNDRYNFKYNSILGEIFKVFCDKTPFIRSFFIKYIYEIREMNIGCYCFCFLFTFLIQTLLINEKIIESIRLRNNTNKYLLINSFIGLIIYISSFRIISIFFNTSFRISGYINELTVENKNNNILLKNIINYLKIKFFILFVINLGLSIFFCIYITIFYSLSIFYQKIWFKYFLLIFLMSLILSIFITLLIVILRNISLSIRNKYLYNSVLIVKRLFDYFIPF